jgi:pimeloyl-ACP methyl ester carboxylesterase
MNASWDVRQAGPADAFARVLLIPGGLCTTELYAELLAEPSLVRAGLGMVAVTMPGFGPTVAPRDVTLENYARLMAAFADDAGCDVVVGHSIGANVALEMAAAGFFSGPLVLLSPAFSRKDEAVFLAVMDRVGRVPGLGALAWQALVRVLPRAVRSSLPPERAPELAAMMGANDPAAARRIVRRYYQYLDRHGSLVARLCDTGVPAWVVRGDHDEIGLQPAERRALEACPGVNLVTVADAGHAVPVEQPAAVAAVILEAVAAASSGR